MPLYEYECPQCQKTFEALQKVTDPPLTQCETCQGPVQKRVSRTSFQLKGTGWYATDYKKTAATTTAAKADAAKVDAPSTKAEKASPAAADSPKPSSGKKSESNGSTT